MDANMVWALIKLQKHRITGGRGPGEVIMVYGLKHGLGWIGSLHRTEQSHKANPTRLDPEIDDPELDESERNGL